MNLKKLGKLNIDRETAGAIFIIIFGAIFILANLFSGFNLFLFLLFGLVGFVLSAAHPRSGIYAILFLTVIFERFFALQTVFWGRNEYKLYPLDVVFAGVLLGIAICIFSGKIKIKFNKIDGLMAIFLLAVLGYFIASLFGGETDFSLSFSSFKNYFFYGLLYFAVSFLFKEKEKQTKLFGFFFAGALGVIFFIIFGVFNGQGLWVEYTPLSTEGVRLLAFTHGFYLSLAVIGFGFYLAEKDKIKKWQSLLLAIWLFGILGSMMRHLWLGLFLAGSLAFFYAVKKEKAVFGKMVMSIVLAVSIFVSVVGFAATLAPASSLNQTFERSFDVVSQRINSFLYSSGDDSFNWREDTWKSTFEFYREHPFSGVGLGRKLAIDEGFSRGFVEVRNIHNSPLVLLVQLGPAVFLIIALATCLLLVKLFSLRGDRISDALFVLIIFYIFVSLFQPYLETNLLGIFFWIMLGLAKVQSRENLGGNFSDK